MNISISLYTLYTLFIELDKFINIHCTDINIFKDPLKLIHTKDNKYKSREKYLLLFDVGKKILGTF